MFRTHFLKTVIFGILGLLLGLLIALVSPKVYEANAELLIGERAIPGGQSVIDPQVQRILEQGTAADSETELQLLRSQTVFFNAFRNAVTESNQENLLSQWVEYFMRYDVLSVEQRADRTDSGGVALVRVRAYNRDLAENIADQVTKVYNEIRVQNARSSSANAVRYLSAQVNSAKAALDNAEKSYKEFATTNAIVDINVTTNSLQSLYNTALNQYNLVSQQYEGAVQEAELLRQKMNEQPEKVSGGAFESRPGRVAYLEQQIAQVRSDLEGRRSRYYDDHPRVMEVREALRKLESELKAEKAKGNLEQTQTSTQRNPVREQLLAALASVEARRESLSQQMSKAQTQMNEIDTKLKGLPDQEARIRLLRRDLDVADLNYRRVKTQFDELDNRKEVFARGALVLSEARAFQNSVAPDTSKYVFIGLISGICFGLLFSFALESLRVRVHNSAQLSDLTGLPVVATVPKLRGQSRTVSALANPGAKPGESFRHMAYTMLARTGDRTAPKMVLFTGVGNVPGRASSSLQFAMAMAASGNRVLLVDCDPVRGLITKAFAAEGRSGVSEIFERTTLPGDTAELFVPTVHDNLSLLPTGADTSRSLADRTNAQVEAFIHFLSEKFDVVVFDLPPCDLFSDASRLAGLVDEVIMVVSASSTHYQTIPTGYEILNRAGAKHVSMVLTDASPQDEPFADTRKYQRTS